MTARDDVYRVVVTKYPARPKHFHQFALQFPGKDFFWPSAMRLYRSRSSAVSRAQLLRLYGAKVRVERGTSIDWKEVPS